MEYKDYLIGSYAIDFKKTYFKNYFYVLPMKSLN